MKDKLKQELRVREAAQLFLVKRPCRLAEPASSKFGLVLVVESNAVSNAIEYAKFYSRSHDAVIRVYDEAGNVIETREHAGEFKEP